MSYSPLYFGLVGTGTATALVTNYINASAVTAIPQGMACSVNALGQVVPLDVSNQANFQAFVGFAYSRIPTSSPGPIVANGRLHYFTTSYPVGTALYVGLDGNPTSIAPSVGVNGFVSGDEVLFLGVLVQNETDPSQKDLAIFSQMIGVL